MPTRLFVAATVALAALGFAPAMAQEDDEFGVSPYKYEYKYGPNQYNYDVEGYGDGGYVSGNVDTNGKYIEGYITNEAGDEVRFEGEWTGYGQIEGYDEDGNYYELQPE